ncbi:MAG: histidine triad nucleotide-binding protein [Oscillospiraceae bacterium]|nr:histidine triad nucleotide-binding protein [Oscillospiraceae bacterium]
MSVPDCLFCKIIAGEIPSTKVYEDEFVLAFLDIAPVTPVHILVIPKLHIVSAADISAENSVYMAKCFEAIAKIAVSEGLDSGFRVITNSGTDGAQSVFHLHFHLLGGKQLDVRLV